VPKRIVALTAALLTANPLGSAEPADSKPEPEPQLAPGIDQELADLVPPARPPQAAAAPAPQTLVVNLAPPAKPVVSPKVTTRPRRGGRPGDVLARIRQCESGSNYRARSESGRYGGAYQFDRRTFASVGGSGDPATASQAEQDYRARLLYQRRGGQPWPVCASRA